MTSIIFMEGSLIWRRGGVGWWKGRGEVSAQVPFKEGPVGTTMAARFCARHQSVRSSHRLLRSPRAVSPTSPRLYFPCLSIFSPIPPLTFPFPYLLPTPLFTFLPMLSPHYPLPTIHHLWITFSTSLTYSLPLSPFSSYLSPPPFPHHKGNSDSRLLSLVFSNFASLFSFVSFPFRVKWESLDL